MRTIARIAIWVLPGVIVASSALVAPARAQAVVAAWGNVEGIRVEGEVFPFEISLCTVNAAGIVVARTAKERQQPRFSRSGDVRTITTRLGAISIAETVEDIGPGEAKLGVRFSRDSATTLVGSVCVDAPRETYGSARILDEGHGVAFESSGGASRRRLEVRAIGTKTMAIGPGGSLDQIGTNWPPSVVLGTERRDGRAMHRARFPIAIGAPVPLELTVKVSGPVDRRPVTLAIDASKPGRVFDGLGGNFRIQNPRVDPVVIAYNLANLRVAWARVEMPWRTWHPDTLADPATQDTTQLHPRVRASMEIARTAAAKGMPVVVSAWFPPQWAVIGPLPPGGRAADGTWGSQLDPAKMERIYRSLTAYLLYLRRHYGVEAVMFSFNESDLGIDVRQTAQEHADLIKGLGAYLKANGLATTMLLGDVSDATPTAFIGPAMRDAATWPYIGAVSYHSWRGWSDSLLVFWSDAAKRLGVPLLVGEGSTDAGAWRYPAIMQEPEFALQEIELYVRMLALSEPRSILQWQLTSDYSLLAGGGVYGDTTALRPTQRFWNLKQLASTPERVAHLPMKCDAPVRCAAFGNAAEGSFAAHIVNTGAARPATLTGIPRGIRSLRVWTTDARRGIQEGPRIAVRDGRAQVTLDAASFTTLIETR